MLLISASNKITLKVEKYISATINKDIEIIKNKFGKPYLKANDMYFNISHTKAIGVAVIEKDECGIDVENIREYNDLIACKICSRAEYEFLDKTAKKDYYFTALWVLKEACLKCLGRGISIPMNKINFIKDNNLCLNIEGLNFDLLDYQGSIIAICRK